MVLVRDIELSSWRHLKTCPHHLHQSAMSMCFEASLTCCLASLALMHTIHCSTAVKPCRAWYMCALMQCCCICPMACIRNSYTQLLSQLNAHHSGVACSCNMTCRTCNIQHSCGITMQCTCIAQEVRPLLLIVQRLHQLPSTSSYAHVDGSSEMSVQVAVLREALRLYSTCVI
jgi:hypothetical protein